MTDIGSPALPTSGRAAPPRVNGELVFDAPWQSRAFGLAAALAEAGRLDWPDFQAALIAEVGRVDRAATSSDGTGDPTIYWQCWLDALSRCCPPSVAERWSDRCSELAARPVGHDH